MVYVDDEREENVGRNVPFMSAGDDGEEGEEVPPAAPTEEEEYE